MARIYVDTNIFIGFYEAAHDSFDVIDDIRGMAEHLIITEQTILEFWRNRQAVLRRSLVEFDKSTRFQPHHTSFIRRDENYKALIGKLQEAREIASRIKANLETALDMKQDVAARKLHDLFYSNRARLIGTSDEILKAAKRRKWTGSPPFSNNSDSIGDQIIWESLLVGCNEDLVIVTRDQVFSDYFEFLAMEFSTGKRTLLAVTKKFSDALAKIGIQAPRKLIEEEKEIEAREKSVNLLRITDGIHPIAEAQIALVADNGTYLMAKSNADGEAEFEPVGGRFYTVFVSHPDFAALEVKFFEPVGASVYVLKARPHTGSLITKGGFTRLPGLAGEFQPIHDSSDRLYIYTNNIAIDGGKLKPVRFQPGQELHFEDANGNKCFVKFVSIIGDCFLVEYRDA